MENTKNRLRSDGRWTFFSVVLVALLGLSLLLAACGENATATSTPAPPTATPVPPTPTPLPDAKTIARDSAEKLLAVNSLHFVVDIQQGKVDLYNGITLKKADGDWL